MSDWRKDAKYAPLDLSVEAPELEKFKQALSVDDDKRNFEIGMKIMREAGPIAGTLGAKYLGCRGIPEKYHGDVLLFHPSIKHAPTQSYHPAIIAPYTDAITGKIKGIHRTYLKADGSGKADIDPPRMTLGSVKGAVVRLIDDAEITYGLGLAEGIESALSVMSMGWTPVWAALNAPNIANFPVLPAVTLTIFADHDRPDKDGRRVGQDAARACGERWAAAGREVFIKTPLIEGQDFNDVLKNKGQK